MANFTQGQVGATYSSPRLTPGPSATSGAVTILTRFSWLTATAISGNGWSCVLGTLTCTRSDALAPGSSYPAITVTVNVANNAHGECHNTANVQVAAKSNTTNDTATEPTTVIQLRTDYTPSRNSGNFTKARWAPLIHLP